MKKLAYRVFSKVSSNRKTLLLLTTIALFVLAAGAPNATIGIGK